MNVAILLFDDFETLDVFGPVEILGRIRDQYNVSFYSQSGNMIGNHHGICIETKRLDDIIDGADIFFDTRRAGFKKRS